MTTLTAIKTIKTNFQVTGTISFPIVAKQTFAGADVVRLQADLFVGTKSHLLIAHEEIKVEWDETGSSKKFKGTISMPIEFGSKFETKQEALAYARNLINSKNLFKVKANLDINQSDKTLKIVATDEIVVKWNKAKKNI